MTTPAQRSFLATVLPVSVMKWISPSSTAGYLTLLNTFLNSVLIIDRELDAQISKDENNRFKLLNLSNRNGEYLTDFHSRTVFHA